MKGHMVTKKPCIKWTLVKKTLKKWISLVWHKNEKRLNGVCGVYEDDDETIWILERARLLYQPLSPVRITQLI